MVIRLNKEYAVAELDSLDNPNVANSASILINDHILFDMPNGNLKAMIRQDIDILKIDTLIISHTKAYPNLKIIPIHMHDKTREEAKKLKLDNLFIYEDGKILEL